MRCVDEKGLPVNKWDNKIRNGFKNCSAAEDDLKTSKSTERLDVFIKAAEDCIKQNEGKVKILFCKMVSYDEVQKCSYFFTLFTLSSHKIRC